MRIKITKNVDLHPYAPVALGETGTIEKDSGGAWLRLDHTHPDLPGEWHNSVWFDAYSEPALEECTTAAWRTPTATELWRFAVSVCIVAWLFPAVTQAVSSVWSTLLTYI